MHFAVLVTTSQSLASTRSRLKKIEALAGVLAEASAAELLLIVAYLSGRLPQGRIGIGPAVVHRVPGLFFAEEPRLEIVDVDERLSAIAGMSGPGTDKRRYAGLSELFARATRAEQAFLMKLLVGELRQGALEGIMVDAVARATGMDPDAIRRAFMFSGDLAAVTEAAMNEGQAGLAKFGIEIFRPLRPMLAQSALNVQQALARFTVLALEAKLDGARIQVHRKGTKVKVFSRSLREVTHTCPEVVEVVASLSVESVILDGEAIALDSRGRARPFQMTMRRFGRKSEAGELRERLPLSCFFFDILFLNAESLVDEPYEERQRHLQSVVSSAQRVPTVVVEDVSLGDGFVSEMIDSGHEGVMAKALDGAYQAGARGSHWLKIKSAMTLDLVVLAAEWGSGRRRGWLSNLHLGARDSATGEYVMLGKTFKGMTDEILEWQTHRLQELEIRRDDWTVYVRPELVVEIAFNELQSSPHYEGGLALRFARLKAYREDKRAEEADTMTRVRELAKAGASSRIR